MEKNKNKSTTYVVFNKLEKQFQIAKKSHAENTLIVADNEVNIKNLIVIREDNQLDVKEYKCNKMLYLSAMIKLPDEEVDYIFEKLGITVDLKQKETKIKEDNIILGK